MTKNEVMEKMLGILEDAGWSAQCLEHGDEVRGMLKMLVNANGFHIPPTKGEFAGWVEKQYPIDGPADTKPEVLMTERRLAAWDVYREFLEEKP